MRTTGTNTTGSNGSSDWFQWISTGTISSIGINYWFQLSMVPLEPLIRKICSFRFIATNETAQQKLKGPTIGFPSIGSNLFVEASNGSIKW